MAFDEAFEVNIDCLAGPTHHFGGLSYGNIASLMNQATLSHPKKAALQGLEKMKLLHDLGSLQIVLPPHPRPDCPILRTLGFEGSDINVLEKAYRIAPKLLLQASSSSAMWAANSCIFTPSVDSLDGKVHITPANLASHFHRSIEAPYTSQLLQQIFADRDVFVHHLPLPSCEDFFDEGAANHTRFCTEQAKKGIHFFVYGKSETSKIKPKKYPARQTKEAQLAIARLHGIPEEQLLFAQQNPTAIDAGVFHNDVISTGYKELFLFHEDAFVNTQKVIDQLQKHAEKILGKSLLLIEVSRKELSVKDAVGSYLFNSQIITAKNKTILIAPMECKKIAAAHEFLLSIEGTSAIDKVLFISLNESMQNGGGPACLRLRAPLTKMEIQKVHKEAFFSDTLYTKLKACIEKYYPETLTLKDLTDPELLHNTREAHLAICKILKLKLL